MQCPVIPRYLANQPRGKTGSPVEREQVRLLKRATGPIGAYDHHDDRCRPLVQLAAERMPYSGSLPADNGNFF